MSLDRAQWPQPGTRIGGYEIGAPLGQGGMASVFEAKHVRLGKRVAVKVVHATIARSEHGLERMLREGRAASAIRHPNIVEVFEVGEHEGVPYLVMELLEGEDLAQHLARVGAMTTSALVDCMLPIVSALAAAHDTGVIHRDLKPSNIRLARLRTGEVCPKVVDFGISKFIADESSTMTRTDTVLGTVHYLAPEQTRGAKYATAKSDQYALGVVLYEAATGMRPFAGESSYELMHAIVTAPLEPPRTRAPQLPLEVEAAIMRAMSRDPQARFASLRDLGAALVPFASARAAERWEKEVTPPSSRRILLATEAPPEPLTLGGTFVSREQTAPRRARRRVFAGAIVPVAVLLAAVAVRASFRTTAVVLEPRSTRPFLASVDMPPPRPEPEHTPEPTAEPTPSAAPAHATHATMTFTPSPARAATPRAPSKVAALPAASGAPVRSPPPTPPEPALGANGAPILE